MKWLSNPVLEMRAPRVGPFGGPPDRGYARAEAMAAPSARAASLT